MAVHIRRGQKLAFSLRRRHGPQGVALTDEVHHDLDERLEMHGGRVMTRTLEAMAENRRTLDHCRITGPIPFFFSATVCI